MKITHIKAQEILDSRGNPTVEAHVTVEGDVTTKAAVPSGASTGSHEALELRDGDDKRYLGKGVQKAVANVNNLIEPELIGMDVTNQAAIDQKMLSLDGTKLKKELGANAILAVSMAVTRAGAQAKNLPLYAYINTLFNAEVESNSDTELNSDTNQFLMPVPMMNVLNGGEHAVGGVDMQEYMIMPVGAPNIQEAIRWGSEIFHVLGKILKEQGYQTTVGDEGGYAPKLDSNEAPLKLIMQAIKQAGYQPGAEISIAMDPAASEFYQGGRYHLAIEDKQLTAEELIAKYQRWNENYPIISIEDGLAEDDWDGFKLMTDKMGDKMQIVGDDLLVTNHDRLKKAIKEEACNSILIKLNQIGSVTETINTIKLAKEAEFTAIVSHRSGETEDTFIADFVVGAQTGQIKTGSLSRSERVAKYNQLMRIERKLGEQSAYASMPFAKQAA